VVHPAVTGRLEKAVLHTKWWGLFDPLSSCRIGRVFVDEMGFKTVPVFE
jgi:hypothetical protein